MPTAKKDTSKTKRPRKKPVPNTTAKKTETKATVKRSLREDLTLPFVSLYKWARSLKTASPHQSFRRTYRRDYARSLKMPGYIAFTKEVWQVLWRNKSIFGLLVGVYALISGVLVGMASQSTYTQIGGLIRETGGDIFQGNFGNISEAGMLLLASLSGGINPNLSESQQLISGLLVLMIWMTTVWLLRALLAGHTPKLRDGLYSAGAPIVPTFILAVFAILQLVPAAVAAIGISAAMPTGLVSSGVEAMLFWAVVALLLLLSLYWLTSTIIALVVVTLPGMYPFYALKTANELVVGRRPRIILRIVWLIVTTVLAWGIIMIPIILFDAWLKGLWQPIEWLPIVPVSLLVCSSVSVVWIASYVYLLYRKVVDDDAAPA